MIIMIAQVFCLTQIASQLQKKGNIKQDRQNQGTNARKVISEVYAFFVLQCTVFGRKSKHKTEVEA